MGAWSATIMGGDDPLDTEVMILRFLGLMERNGDYFDREDHPEILRQALELKSNSDWVNFFGPCNIAGKNRDFWINEQTASQVLAVMHLECGATLPTIISQKAIETCQEEDCSIWNNPEERRFYLDQLIEQIQNFDGTPVEVASEGLFEKLFKHMQQEKASRRLSP